MKDLIPTELYLIFIAVSVLVCTTPQLRFYLKHRENLRNYQPVLKTYAMPVPVVTVFFLSALMPFWATRLAWLIKPSIFITLSFNLTGMLLILYLTTRKLIVPYFLNDKVILWNPGLIKSETVEIPVSSIDALIHQIPSKATLALAKNARGIESVNFTYKGVKKSFSFLSGIYLHEHLDKYFKSKGISIYSKVISARTAQKQSN